MDIARFIKGLLKDDKYRLMEADSKGFEQMISSWIMQVFSIRTLTIIDALIINDNSCAIQKLFML